MRVNFEVHTHTRFSHDSMLNKYFYLLMLKLRKINTVAITDHNEIKGALRYKEFLGKHGIKVVIGEEIFTDSGEIIGLFLEKKIEPNKSPRNTMLEIKKQSGLVYIPHPYDEKRFKTVLPENFIRDNIDLIDIIEVHNGRNVRNSFSVKQKEIADNFPQVHQMVGSDAHTFFELGRNYNILDSFSTQKELLKNLNDVVYVKKDCLGYSHQVTKFVRLFRLMLKGDINGLFRIINKRIRKKKLRVS